MKFDKIQIINRIKLHNGFRKDKDLAAFLGVLPQTISNWINRGDKPDWPLIFEKCWDYDMNWLIKGEEVSENSHVLEKDALDGDILKLYREKQSLIEEIEQLKKNKNIG